MANPEALNTQERRMSGGIEQQSSGSSNHEIAGSADIASQNKQQADAVLKRLYTNAKKEPTTLSAPPAVGHAHHDHPKGIGQIPVAGHLYGIFWVLLGDIWQGLKGLKGMAGVGGGHGGGGHAKKDDHGHGGGHH